MFKRYNNILILLLLFCLCIHSASADSYKKYCFQDAVTSIATTNVNMNGWICTGSGCTNTIGPMWGGQIINAADTPPNNCITWRFPTSLQGTGYTLIVFSEGYKSKLIAEFTTDANNPGTTEINPLNYPFNPVKLNKQAGCSSPVSLSVVNNITENLPVSVTSGANLDATTASAMGSSYKNGFPNSMDYYFEVETTLHLKIYKYDSATSKNIGSPIHTQDVIKRIYYDDTVSVSFADWMPPEQVDQFTYYNVTVESDVTDPKCSSKVNQRASKIMRVWRDDPRNECYSLIDTNGLVISPADSDSPEEVNVPQVDLNELSFVRNLRDGVYGII